MELRYYFELDFDNYRTKNLESSIVIAFLVLPLTGRNSFKGMMHLEIIPLWKR
jgi:hypothetical protein